ncbi:hypothetical protein CC85DRAFT_288674 [Cutaneotrichosporon oleaginosum]|uniref:Autophagy-related protein 4 n=1 Tax=Cutaneotrichosporon oleaginosum TaxID=879819 RepID=A0A0J0XE83_9TREE|nr:uncharacterized protein CC85DRAFT_288674 [Cutaneotrichosporon oleaginosum]KLT39348.1 hypothetical protein CC85DRAFT_288674 [Cutaneotrichosporon oleaginosum]TXT08544.1 hypothetical protein COLE_05468 [Cutaneotrichosporon oleaginosum]
MSGIDSPQRRDSHLTVSSQASSSRSHSPLPVDGAGAGSGQPRRKLSLFRPHNRGRSTPSPMVSGPEDEDDEWLIEGGTSNGRVDPDASMGREASTLSRSVDTLSIERVQVAPRVEKRDGRGKRLAKKTSRLFHRATGSNSSSNGHNDDTPAHAPPSSASNLPIPLAGRQSSFSSSASSNETGASRKWGSLARVHSRESPIHRSSGESSQPSSWQYHSNTKVRRASSSTNEDSIHGMNIQTLRPRESSGQLSQFSTSAPHTARPLMLQPPPNAQSQTAGGRGWFSNLLGSSGEQSGSPQQQHDVTATPPSPLRKGPSFLTGAFAAVRTKAANGLRTLVDSEAQPDHCQEAMYVMGVKHPGWTPASDDPFHSETPTSGELSSPWSNRLREGSGSSSTPPTKLSTIFGSSFNLAAQADGPSTPSPDAAGRYRKDKAKDKEILKWPDGFYDDFRSRVWCTYRSNYPPIQPFHENTLLPTPQAYYGAFSTSEHAPSGLPSQSTPTTGRGGWLRGETLYTSDSGWGCMLRTGQSILANALIDVHLGRGWRLPQERPKLHPETPMDLALLEAYATHVRILSWFLDDPSPLCPFSVHRMAMIGKELGKEIGQWFGPSTAAGALRSLANSFPICGVSVVSAQDGIIYKSDVFAASNTTTDGWEPQSPRKMRPISTHRSSWGNQAVLILVATRLGLDNVNPIYYDSIKNMFEWPQSVGIAGGRPDSSYYFVGTQANHLFYLDPHYTRPAVPPRVPPLSAATSEPVHRDSWSGPPLEEDEDNEMAEPHSPTPSAGSAHSVPVLGVVDVDRVEESPARTKRSRRLTPMQPLRIDPQTPPRTTTPPSPATPTLSAPHPPSVQASPAPSRHAAHGSIPNSVASSMRKRLPVDPQTAWYASAYPEDKLKTFHCDRVKKLPLSGLDPSMLLGFLVQSEAEFDDFCERVAQLPQKIFAVQEELQSWSDDEDGALESVSEGISGPEMDSDDEDEDGPGDGISEMLSEEAVEIDEFGRVGSTSARSAPYPARPFHAAQRGAVDVATFDDDSTPDISPDTTLDLSMDDSHDEAERMPTLTARPSFATIPRKPSYSSDVPTVKGHLRGASTSAVPRPSHSRGASTSVSVLAHRRTASAQPSPHSHASSSSGSGSGSGSNSFSGSRSHSRRGSSPASPFGPSPIVTARRPPSISVPDRGMILPPPRSASLSAPTSAKLVDALDTSGGIPRILDPDHSDGTEELVTVRPSLEFEAETETLETVGAETPDEDEDRSSRRASGGNGSDIASPYSFSPPVSPPELPLSPLETLPPLPRSQAGILPRSYTQETVMPRSATQETVKQLPRGSSQRSFDEWDVEDEERPHLSPTKGAAALDTVCEK